MKIKNVSEEPKGNDVSRIVSNRFFTIYGRKRQTPNEFTKLAKARDEFMNEIYSSFNILVFNFVQLVEIHFIVYVEYRTDDTAQQKSPCNIA